MSGESPSLRKWSRARPAVERMTSPNRGICRYLTFQISNISSWNTATEKRKAARRMTGQINIIEMPGGERGTYAAAPGGSDALPCSENTKIEMKHVGQISPQHFLLQGRESDWPTWFSSASLLHGSCPLLRSSCRGELAIEPVELFGPKIELEELDRIGVLEIKALVVFERGNPGAPVHRLESSYELAHFPERHVRVVLDCLPEVLGGIVDGTIELDAFVDQEPVRQHTPRDGRRSRSSNSGSSASGP